MTDTGQAIALSVVIPTFNRGATLGRAIQSILQSNRDDLEVIVVDDSSDDETQDVLGDILDTRLRVVRLAENAGVCAARGIGTAAARAEWVCFVDSDDELSRDAVSEVLAAVSSVGKEIMAVYFRCLHDDGVVTPRFVPSFGRLDYNQYVQLMALNTGRDRDVLYSARRVCFDVVPWALERVEELEHHLNFNQKFRTYLHPATLYLVHSDGSERLTSARDGAGSDAIRVKSFERIMEVHGPALRESGRQLWREVLVRLLALTFAVDGRRAGLRVLSEYGLDPASVPRALGVLLLGLLGPRAVQRARLLRRRLPV